MPRPIGVKNGETTRRKIKCKICGELFYAWPYLIKRGFGMYCSKKCHIEYQKGTNSSTKSEFQKGEHTGESHPRWNGGKTRARGYTFCYHPERSDRRHNYIPEHRIVMENHIGRVLDRKEVVHHINGDKSDNRIENLVLCPDDSYHHRVYHPKWKNHSTPRP